MMVGAACTEDNKQHLLLLGLSRQNVARIMDGEPIWVSSKSHPNSGVPENLTLVICFGETELSLFEQAKRVGLVDSSTQVYVDPKLQKPNCYDCVHRGLLFGDAHSQCCHPRVCELHVAGDPHGIEKGWFAWPFNFDPVWLQACDGFTPKPQPPETK